MACGCNKRRQPPQKQQDASREADYDVMGGYKYLTDRQIKARLEVYKKRYCKGCPNRYKCDYPMYVQCKNPNNGTDKN